MHLKCWNNRGARLARKQARRENGAGRWSRQAREGTWVVEVEGGMEEGASRT